MDVGNVSSDDEFDDDGNHGHSSGAMVLHTSASQDSQDLTRVTRQESARTNEAINSFAAMAAPGISRTSSAEVNRAIAAMDDALPNLTCQTTAEINREIAELTAYQSESASASASDPPVGSSSHAALFGTCDRHPHCNHARGLGHPGKCTWYDEDTRRQTWIPDDDRDWIKPRKMATETVEEVQQASVRQRKPADKFKPQTSKPKPTIVKPPPAKASKASKAGKAKQTEFGAIEAAVAKRRKEAAAALEAEREAESELKIAAQAEKNNQRRDAAALRRMAAKKRLEAERDARAMEQQAADFEARARQLSQTYG